MVALNTTYALTSALSSSMRSSGCTSNDIEILTGLDYFEYSLNKFACFVPLDWSPSLLCDPSSYLTITPQCSTCTFSQINQSVLICLERCSREDSSDFCKDCVGAFMASWTDACTLQRRSSELSAPSSICSSLNSQREYIANQLSVCLSVNETRAIDCMTDNGFSNIPKDCSNCLFSSQYITDTVCHNLCMDRPYSGPCIQCINAFVSNSIRSCFTLESYAMTSKAACTVSDMSLIGPAGSNVDTILNACKESVSCMVSRSGYLIPGKGTVSNDCIQCINTGETRSGYSCTENSCADITTDCGYAPSIPSSDVLCSTADLGAFYTESLLLRSINDCLYISSNRTIAAVVECIKVPDNTNLNNTLSENCQSCMSRVLSNLTSCTVTCEAYGNQSATCQDCVGKLLSFSISSCFGAAKTDVCTLHEATNVAYQSWSLAVLQRCLLANNFTDVSPCMNEAGMSSPGVLIDFSFDCRNCMSMFLMHSDNCKNSCKNKGTDSNECRSCTTESLTGMLRNCTRNESLISTIPETRGLTHHSKLIYTIAITFLTLSLF